MLIGAHSIIYSKHPEADRAFLRDVLELPSVDVGDGWCDDVELLVAAMTQRNIACSPVQDQGWGLLTEVALPGGGRLGIYQPRHARPKPMSARRSPKKRSTR
jgi:hypothetical protein